MSFAYGFGLPHWLTAGGGIPAPTATFDVLNSAGVLYTTTNLVLSSLNVTYLVPKQVLSSTGVSYTVL